MFRLILNTNSIIPQFSAIEHVLKLITIPFSKSPLLGNVDLKNKINNETSGATLINVVIGTQTIQLINFTHFCHPLKWQYEGTIESIIINIFLVSRVKCCTFWRPGNLNLVLLRASITWALCLSVVRTDNSGWPILTRATVPCGLPNAPRIPVCRRSAPKIWKIIYEQSYFGFGGQALYSDTPLTSPTQDST